MIFNKKKTIILLSFLFGLASLLNAQMIGNGHMNSNGLDEITVIGTAIVEETTMNPIYYLDEDGDGWLRNSNV